MTTLRLIVPGMAGASSLRSGLAAFWRRGRPALFVLLPIALAAAALYFGFQAWQASRTNAGIAALAEGRDVPVDIDGAPALMLARTQFLSRRDRLEEAEPLVEAIERHGDPDLSARARYSIANARLRQAFERLSRSDLDPAGPLVVLARQDYRRALQARPDFWDAKFNLDVASRLIRDFPDFDRKQGDDLKTEPKKIWTDIPGQPRGAP